MARHARRDEDLGSLRSKPSTSRARRSEARAAEERARRLAERDRISGEIHTPADITAKRARRADRPNQPRHPASAKAPVSASALVPERTFSGRTILLTIVALVVLSFVVPTVRSYIQQQAEITELSADIRQEEQRQAELYSELNRWEDPEYIQQQARQRLQLVQPGESRYHLVGDLHEEAAEVEAEQQEEPEEGWTGQLWDSVVDAAEGESADEGNAGEE
ncbi:FtsB family cell division protein [Nesterenkonia alba]|uniref:FtsB family cell division protein n=1 Tax=Nesterenkonia alba TaxID=515814 RepID=UPI0003B62130|nr:septum formation initiator family protein [Nesterenkonia alba]